MPDKPMTRKQVEDLLENASLRFTQVVRETMDEYGDKQKEEQRLAREYTYEQGTGYSWEQRRQVRDILHWADGAKKNSTLIRSASILAIITIGIKSFWGDIFGV